MNKLFLILPVFAFAANSADFTTYIGDANQYQVSAVATDAAGNTYVTGSRIIQLAPNISASDVFATKLDASGNIVFTTTFGGKGTDQALAIALDPAGNIWIGGSTSSKNLPLDGAFETSPGAGFLIRLSPDGRVIYSSYFDGIVNGVATDKGGNVYVTGLTTDKNFPVTPGLPDNSGLLISSGIYTVSGAFITKLDPTASHIIYSTVIAGGKVDCGAGSTCFLSYRVTTGVAIAVDPAGNTLVAGNANVTDLPITPGATAGYGAFGAKINAAGNQLVYLTYLGPPAGMPEIFGPPQIITAAAIATDASGDAYIAGSTNDTKFPATPGAYQTTLSGDLTQDFPTSDAFALKLSATGGVAWGTYLGGPGNDAGKSISLDGAGNVWLVGNNAAGFPPNGPGYETTAGDFIRELSADGSKLMYSAGFASGTAGQAVAIEPAGTVHVAGSVGLVSTITPSQAPTARILGIMNAAAGAVSGRIAAGEVISIFGYGLGPVTGVSAAPGNGSFPTTLGGVQVLVNGTPIPLIYVSSSQINAEVSAPLNGVENGASTVQVMVGSTALPRFRVELDTAIFGVFQNADGSLAAINQDGTLNSASNPAKAGTIVSVWATGFIEPGATVDGSVNTGANNWCGSCQIAVGNLGDVSYNSGMQTVDYAGAAPGIIDGVMQINFTVPKPVSEDMGKAYLNFNGLGASGFFYVSN